MATNTTNYNFKKPDESDFYSVQDQNNNWDKADTALKNLDTPTFEDYSGSTTAPDAATAINNIKSKGKLSTILSNMKAAFKGACLIGQIVNNCVTNNAKLPLSAAQGKALMDLYTQLNSDLALEDVGNAVAATNWTVVASNRVMNNDLGMVYGKIIHNASVAPVWGELVATFPGFKSYYDMPLPLYCTDGNLYITANLNAAGQIKLYNPDLAKLNTKDKVYSFTAVYLRKK